MLLYVFAEELQPNQHAGPDTLLLPDMQAVRKRVETEVARLGFTFADTPKD